MSAENFIAQYLTGKCRPEDIHDFIDKWHEGNGGAPLWQFLGVSRDDYGRWVENSTELQAIVQRYRFPEPGASSTPPPGKSLWLD